MGDRPSVSVVIIFLNVERFLQEAVESVYGQTFTDWELILVDDGSTDRSSAIALECARHQPVRVRYLEHARHQNLGMSASRNLGMASARGEFIALLDADDVWLPHKLERQVAILRSQPHATMVYGLSQWWYSWSGNSEDIRNDYVPDLGVTENVLFRPPALLKLVDPLGNATVPCPSNLMFRRDAIQRVGGFEDSFRGMCEDRVFLTKVYLKESVFVAGECWDRYRQHADSCCSVAERAGQYYPTRLFFLNWLAAYLTEQSVEDPEIWKVLRGAVWRSRYPTLQRLRRRVRLRSRVRSYLRQIKCLVG